MYLKAFIFIIPLLSLFAGKVLAEEAAQPIYEILTIPENKEVIEFETKIGIVSFAHKKHASLSTTECMTCHHTLEPADKVVKPCHECHQHKKNTETQDTKSIFHTRCTTCHEYTIAGGQSAGPLLKKCKLCHIK